MRLSSARAGTEPLAALAAILAVCVGVTVYAGAATDLLGSDESDVAETVLDRVARSAGPGGTVTVGDLQDIDVAPPGWKANVTLRTTTGRISYGPPPAMDARRAHRQVAVQLVLGEVEPGRLTVEVWK